MWRVAFVLLGVLANISTASDDCDSVLAEEDDFALIQGRLALSKAGKDLTPETNNLATKIAAGKPEVDGAGFVLDRDYLNASTTTTAKPTTTAKKPLVKGTAIKMNDAGDLPAFLSAIRFNIIMIILFFTTACCCMRRYPEVYAYRATDGWSDPDDPKNTPDPAPRRWDPEVKTWLMWAYYSWSWDTTEVEETCGLDAAMLLEFTVLAMQLMLVFGLPALFIGIPIYAVGGGGFAKEDRLSWPGVANVVYTRGGTTLSPEDEKNLPEVQWIWWLLALVVWGVVIFTQGWVFRWQRLFIQRREKWLLATPAPFATTILVEGIPAEYRTDREFKEFFQKLFPSSTIKDAFVVKNLPQSSHCTTGCLIQDKIAAYIQAEQDLHEAEFRLQKARDAGYNEESGDNEITGFKSEIEEHQRKAAALKSEIEEEQRNIKELAAQTTSTAEQVALYTTSGFVTFGTRPQREMAANVRIGTDTEEWMICEAPAPADVIWTDLMIDDSRKKFDHLIGYGLVIALAFVYMPIIGWISNLNKKIEDMPALKNLLTETGLKSTVDGELSTLGVLIMTSFLPTFLMWIFHACFVFRSESFRQMKLQVLYFWFLIFFVLLVPCIGANVEGFAAAIAKSPLHLFKELADVLPQTTHFFMKYVATQPFSHAMNLTRYMSLIKYVMFKQVCDPERAHELSEPEDQDYYGYGSRSARFTLILMMGIVFGTICPLMHIVVFGNFFMCRLIYGYLIPFAESRKNDSGGHFWCTQLHHVHQSILIYIIMMVGILAQRSESKVPPAIAAVSFVWWLLSYLKYMRALAWETICFKTVVLEDSDKKRPLRIEPGMPVDRYAQKEIENTAWLPE